MKILTSPLRGVEQRIALGLGMICLVGFQLFASQSALSAGVPEWRQLVQDKKWGDAVIALRYELKQGPQREDLIEALARALVFDHRREEALALLSATEAKESRPKKREQWRARIRVVSSIFVEDETFQKFQRGLNLWAAGDLEGARVKLNEAWAREPDHGGILIRQGQLALLMQQPTLAIEKLRASRVYNPFEPQALLWLAQAQELAQDLEGARQTLAEFSKHAHSKSATAREILLDYRLRHAQSAGEALRWLRNRVQNAREPGTFVPLALAWLEALPEESEDQKLRSQIETTLKGLGGMRSYGFGENFSVIELPSVQRVQAWKLRLERLTKISSTP